MSGLILYLFILNIILVFIGLIQYCSVNKSNGTFCKKSIPNKYVLLLMFTTLPIIFIYTYRYGIGADYFSYERIYNDIKDSSFSEYWKLHSKNIGSFYVEPGYFILNRYFGITFQSVNLLCISLMLFFVFITVSKFSSGKSFIFSLFIFYCNQFIHSMNVVRFAIALTIILLGYVYIIKRQILKWIIVVLFATMFHSSCIVCLPLYLLTDFKSESLNKVRNILYYGFVIFFPLVINIIFIFASFIPLFARYFSVARYTVLDKMNFDFVRCSLVIIPMLPFIICKTKFFFTDKVSSICFRIAIFQIPMQELGLSNIIFARLTRFLQMIEIILIPYLLSKIKNKNLKLIITAYLLMFYITFFIYYALKGDKGDSLMYRTIFNF